MNNRQRDNLLASLQNILQSGYQVTVDKDGITIVIMDRLLNEDQLMRMFECFWVYNYKEQELAYVNRRYIDEYPLGEVFVFIER